MANYHEGQPVLASGAALEQAKVAVIMIHGRGSNARDILSISADLAHDDIAFLAPQANGGTWYPLRFIEPLEKNEPYLTMALEIIAGLVEYLNEAGIPNEKIVLLGFSQGACLSLEYAARHAKRYGGVIGLSGALIGGEGTPRNYAGTLDNTPVFLGCSDIDFHIPVETVHSSTEIMRGLGGDVTERIYAGMGHTINEDEIQFVNELLGNLLPD